MRKITLTFDRENYGSWPYRAATDMPGAPKGVHAPEGVLIAGGPTEEAALQNLRRIVRDWPNHSNGEYPKVVEVDW